MKLDQPTPAGFDCDWTDSFQPRRSIPKALPVLRSKTLKENEASWLIELLRSSNHGPTAFRIVQPRHLPKNRDDEKLASCFEDGYFGVFRFVLEAFALRRFNRGEFRGVVEDELMVSELVNSILGAEVIGIQEPFSY